jgi:hypothetical protein
MTHQKPDPCPFKDDGHPIGVFGSCCSFRGNVAALYLLALGLGWLAPGLYTDKTPEEAITFAARLREAIERLRETMNAAAQRANQPVDDLFTSGTVKVPDVGWEFPIGQGVDAIEAVARWYDKIGQMGFGVHAWS